MVRPRGPIYCALRAPTPSGRTTVVIIKTVDWHLNSFGLSTVFRVDPHSYLENDPAARDRLNALVGREFTTLQDACQRAFQAQTAPASCGRPRCLAAARRMNRSR